MEALYGEDKEAPTMDPPAVEIPPSDMMEM
jgi:hypothetical protein